LDTLQRERFHQLTKRDRLADVLAGLEAADAAGLRPVKVNAVVMSDSTMTNPQHCCAGVSIAVTNCVSSSNAAGRHWNRASMVTAAEILARLSEEFDLEPNAAQKRGSTPADSWIVDGDTGKVGVIGSVTCPFCGACDRVRLTADGHLRNCLFAHDEGDLPTLLRADADDAAIARRMRDVMRSTRPGHGIDDPAFLQSDRPMSAIGG
jgi:cyclic pyranopterin phosphate synthase